MVNLKEKPYFLKDGDISWVENTIKEMSDEEKVGQLFFALTSGNDKEKLEELTGKYHVGGCRYNPMKGEEVRAHNQVLQKSSKIPLFIACNTETGINGACSDGQYISSALKIAASGKPQYAYDLGKYSNRGAAAIGCNMAFAPVCDIHLNPFNTEVMQRCFGNDSGTVAEMSVEYLKGAHSIDGFASVAKHFPGNGLDPRDAHISNNINNLSKKDWLDSFGKVYSRLFEEGVDAVMGGHIMMPAYMKELYPDMSMENMLPATLCPEIMTGLLRDTLGFNGMVVSDASHMVAMTCRMKRRDMLPAAINAGCDMFLFFNDPDEDFSFMLDAYRSGVISKERMNEALSRILGLKAKMGLHKKPKDALVPAALDSSLLSAPSALASDISRDAITLVKYKDRELLPLTPEKYKRIMIVYVKGAGHAMEMFAKLAMGEEEKMSPAELLAQKLSQKGFEVFIYESPLEKMKKQIEAGEKPSLNLYFAGKHAISDFTSDKDLVITLFDVATGHPAFGMSKGGGEIPWYVFELPVVTVSLGSPILLFDVPFVRTYINAYDQKEHTIDMLVQKLTEGEDGFLGTDPTDSYCGLLDTKI